MAAPEVHDPGIEAVRQRQKWQAERQHGVQQVHNASARNGLGTHDLEQPKRTSSNIPSCGEVMPEKTTTVQ